jgi:serine protease SohB
MDFLSEYAGFLAKTITFLLAFAVIIALLTSRGGKTKSRDGVLKVRSLNDFYRKLHGTVEQAIVSKAAWKAQKKSLAKAKKATEKSADQTPGKKRVFVLDFKGDVDATALSSLRHEVTALLGHATDKDEVVLRLESPGGGVSSYGLASSQLVRIRDAGIPLTICVDQVAASGGYMMACLGNKILCAPFALVGSIGVVAEVPNVNRLLKKHGIDFEVMTAGEHKRTITVFGENTEKGREKFTEYLKSTHELFKTFVAKYRPHLNIETVADGDVWYGTNALENNLVDQIITSDEYLQSLHKDADLLHLTYTLPKERGLKAMLASSVGSAVENALAKLSNRVMGN